MTSISKSLTSPQPAQSNLGHYQRVKPGLCLPHLLLDKRIADGFRKNILTLLHSYYAALTMSILLVLDLLLVIGEIILAGYMRPVVQLSTACNATELKPSQEAGATEALYRVPVDCGFTVDLALPHDLEVNALSRSPLLCLPLLESELSGYFRTVCYGTAFIACNSVLATQIAQSPLGYRCITVSGSGARIFHGILHNSHHFRH